MHILCSVLPPSLTSASGGHRSYALGTELQSNTHGNYTVAEQRAAADPFAFAAQSPQKRRFVQ